MKQRISASLYTENGRICCASCCGAVAATNESWKSKVRLSSIPVKALPGSGRNVESGVLLRRFLCSHCGHLLDTETALPEDPFLEDVVKV
jgi:acetone carboxylase gamma subunit